MGCDESSTETKVCANCRVSKPVTEFNKSSKHARTPYQGYCRVCQSEKYRAWVDKNHAHKLAYVAGWYDANVAQVKARDKRRWSEPSVQAKAKAIKAANRERYNSYYHNYRAKKVSAEGSYTDADIARIFRDQRGRCAICRKSIKRGYHIDHIQPLSKGGSNWPSNLQLTCGSCNFSKADTDPIKYMQRLGRLL